MEDNRAGATLDELLPLADTSVSRSELAEAERKLGTPLPTDLRDFLLASDGSVWTDFPECAFQINRLQSILDLWSLPAEDRSGPQHIIDVASDGSRVRFCFDPRTGGIVILDITSDQPVAVASTLTELVQKLRAGWNPFSVYED
jgi:SMI1/KNR4 family protein SUKH-1